MAKAVKKQRKMDWLKKAIISIGIKKPIEFYSKLNMTREDFALILNGRRPATDTQMESIKKALAGVDGLDQGLKDWRTGVKRSLGRKKGAKKKARKKQVTPTAKVKKVAKATPVVKEKVLPPEKKQTDVPTCGQVLDHLNGLPGVPEKLILHVMKYYRS